MLQTGDKIVYYGVVLSTFGMAYFLKVIIQKAIEDANAK